MWLTAVRDIAIVLLALESLVIGILLAVMLVQLRKLMRMLRDEIAPVLRSANDTVDTMRGTTHFLSQNLVEPAIKISSVSSGAWQAVRNLLFIRRRVGGRSSKDTLDGSIKAQ